MGESEHVSKFMKLWKRLPKFAQEKIYRALKPTGIPYLVGYATKYKRSHDVNNYAGNLLPAKQAYHKSTGAEKESYLAQFHAIIDNLVMTNGVTKTTYSMRQAHILSRVLGDERCRIKKNVIRVLDVPSSIGTASLDIFRLLSEQYGIDSYVLGDLYFKIYCDLERGCIYDEERNLLQVKLKHHFFSIYRPHLSGDIYNAVAHCFLWPVDMVSWYFKRRYRYAMTNNYYPVELIHPEIDGRLKDGVFKVAKLDVFKNIEDKFDMIISFNLLQRSYFPVGLIQLGVENLKNALNEGGLLIMGNTESFSVARKNNGGLLLIDKEGEF